MQFYLHTSLKEHDIDELWTGLSPILRKLRTTTTAFRTIVCVVLERENKKITKTQQQLNLIITIIQCDYNRETHYDVNYC